METAEKFDVFPGIVNENEFYSHHFFAHVFQSRIKDWLQERAQAESGTGPAAEPPAKRLTRLAAPFFQQRARYPADEDFAARLQWHRDLHRELLRDLGCRLDPQEFERVGGQPLPVWASVGKGGGRTAGLPDLVVLPAFNPDQRPRQEDQVTDPLVALLDARQFRIEEVPAA